MHGTTASPPQWRHPAGKPASPLATQVHVNAGGTAPGVPTHGHQHMPLEGVQELPPDEHLQAEGGAGACPEPRSPSASLSTAWTPTAAVRLPASEDRGLDGPCSALG